MRLVTGTLRRWLRIIWPLAGFTFAAWLWIGFQALPGTPPLRPGRARSEWGLIFLPGGLVEPRAYGPLLQPLADAGHPVELVELPWRCACTEAQRAELFDRIAGVMASRPQVRWTLAGHSRGAMLAARFVHERRPPPAALVLIGTTHPRDFSLAALPLPVWKIYGTRDGVAPLARSESNRHLLPADARWVRIEGGNHTQFGSYRWQLLDHAAAVSRESQRVAVQRTLLEVFRALRETPSPPRLN
ncbi:MAG: alpha/beta hydrolase [Bryobacteraceae bacterium]|nr:alpha/beta hydrolase [Bryobacteraceae bacterium]